MHVRARSFRWPLAAIATLILVLAAGALRFSSAAKAGSPACSDAVTSAPTTRATVSSASTAFGKALVIGSGAYTGCSLYLLTSDQLHSLTGSHFACSDTPNAVPASPPCDTVLWPALLTDGAPIAGPGVKAKLLGTVTRTDLPGLPAVQEVTYAGQPLYRFTFDDEPGDTQGANLFDPVTSPTGIWDLVDPSRGTPATGAAQLQLETAPLGASGPEKTVLAVTMNNAFTDLFASAGFPVYTLSPGHGHGHGHDHGKGGHGPMGPGGPCQALCQQYWLPVLTSGRPQAGDGVDQHALGTMMRPDGTQQVTYRGRPLYLFADDAYLPPFPYNAAVASINGAGANTMWGVFDTVPAVH
jgi:predicted lipoprotein with Yx(FWY)xxD motif